MDRNYAEKGASSLSNEEQYPLRNCGLFRIRQGNKDHVSALDRSAVDYDSEASFLRHRDRFTPVVKPYDHLAAAFFQVQRMSMALRAETQDSQSFVLENAQISIVVGIDFCGHCFSMS
jgi:hypothetical protein